MFCRAKVARGIVGCLTLAASAACGGGEAFVELEPTLENIQVHIFTPACATSGCHDAQDQAGDLDLSAAQVSYDAMVNVSSKIAVAKANGWVMVVPGDPERSFLVRKLVGPGLGELEPMPSASQQLNAYYVDLIRTWIADGAPR